MNPARAPPLKMRRKERENRAQQQRDNDRVSQSYIVLLTSALLFAGDTGMNADRLARIPARMQAFVDRGAGAGYVTLVARHGRVASLAAVGYHDRESRTPMRTDTIFQIMS